MKFKRLAIGVAAAAMLTAPTFAPAQAANGDQLIAGGDFSAPTINGLLNVPNATTDFTQAVLGVFGTGNGSIYDPGTYTVGTNPAAVHEAWADFSAANDPMLIVNGFTDGHQKVISITTQGQVCDTPGSSIYFEFGANATNILRPEYAGGNAPGANISVTVNGTSIGSQDLTGLDPNNPVSFGSGVPVPASPTGEYVVTIWNDGTAYTGNDFAIDDITLTQVGDCAPPCVETADTHQWFNYTGNIAGTPALDDPNWHATDGNPRSANHKWENHTDGLPYFVSNGSKGKGDWFKWVTTPGHHCTVS